MIYAQEGKKKQQHRDWRDERVLKKLRFVCVHTKDKVTKKRRKKSNEKKVV